MNWSSIRLLWETVTSLTEVQVDNTCHYPLVYQDSHFIAEVYRVDHNFPLVNPCCLLLLSFLCWKMVFKDKLLCHFPRGWGEAWVLLLGDGCDIFFPPVFGCFTQSPSSMKDHWEWLHNDIGHIPQHWRVGLSGAHGHICPVCGSTVWTDPLPPRIFLHCSNFFTCYLSSYGWFAGVFRFDFFFFFGRVRCWQKNFTLQTISSLVSIEIQKIQLCVI